MKLIRKTLILQESVNHSGISKNYSLPNFIYHWNIKVAFYAINIMFIAILIGTFCVYTHISKAFKHKIYMILSNNNLKLHIQKVYCTYSRNKQQNLCKNLQYPQGAVLVMTEFHLFLQ